MSEIVIDVQGMTCNHCVSSVIEELTKIDGVTSVIVDLQPGLTSHVQVHSSHPLATAALQSAIEEAGYALATS